MAGKVTDCQELHAISAGDEEVGELVADAMEKVSQRWRYYDRRIQDNAKQSLTL